MSEVVVNAEIRQSTKKHAKYARWNGMIPGVYYSRGEENINIQVPAPALSQLVFTSEAHVIDLRLADGSTRKAILKDVQFDPVTDQPVHFDFQGLKEHEKLTIEIPVVLTGGVPKGVRDGGMLQHFIHKLKVSCLPKDIPEKFEINVAELGINDFVHVSSLTVPNVTIVEALGSAIVGVMPPTLVKEEEAPAATEEAAAAEPEVVGKGKKEEEGEEGAAPAKAGAPAKGAAPSKGEAKPEK
ncbi:MAG: 50S ribosomal protein L25 [Bacteroidetes bacterium]|nr:50S ribosomal protein L25 [Bacteroidota bacterium]